MLISGIQQIHTIHTLPIAVHWPYVKKFKEGISYLIDEISLDFAMILQNMLVFFSLSYQDLEVEFDIKQIVK